MNKLSWRSMPHADLAQLLGRATLSDSRAVGASTVYHLSVEGRDQVAIALPDGQAVLVETNGRVRVKRRRIDPVAP